MFKIIDFTKILFAVVIWTSNSRLRYIHYQIYLIFVN
jgi:hypothetical protein